MTFAQSIIEGAYEDASAIIDEASIAKTVERWIDDDYRGFGLTNVDARTVLIGWLAVALAGARLDVAAVTAVLNRFPTSFDVDDEDLEEMTRQMYSTMDYQSATETDADAIDEKRHRYHDFTDAIRWAQVAVPYNVDDRVQAFLGRMTVTVEP